MGVTVFRAACTLFGSVSMSQSPPKPRKQPKVFYFEHPHPLLVEILWCWALQGHSGAGHSGDTLGLGTPGDSGQFRATLGTRETLGLGTPGTIWVGQLRATLGVRGDSGLGSGNRRLWVWAFQGESGAGHANTSKFPANKSISNPEYQEIMFAHSILAIRAYIYVLHVMLCPRMLLRLML